jgi:hypothetical protein
MLLGGGSRSRSAGTGACGFLARGCSGALLLRGRRRIIGARHRQRGEDNECGGEARMT